MRKTMTHFAVQYTANDKPRKHYITRFLQCLAWYVISNKSNYKLDKSQMYKYMECMLVAQSSWYCYKSLSIAAVICGSLRQLVD